MKKIMLPIIAATTLTVNATDHVTHTRADHLNLPNAHKAHQNAYDEFVVLMEKFETFEGQNIFTIEITKNNVEKIFNHIEENLEYWKFQNVIDYAKFLKNDFMFYTFEDINTTLIKQLIKMYRDSKLNDPLNKTFDDVTVKNVKNIFKEIDLFFFRFRIKN